MRILRRMLGSVVWLAGFLVLVAVVVSALALWVPNWQPTLDIAYRDRDCVAGPLSISDTVVTDDALGTDWDCRREEFTVANSQQAFSVNFLEFKEDGSPAGARIGGASAQLLAFRDVLAQDEKSYVITFTHGWRNNADRYNNDLRKFRIFLSYAAAFVDQRCHEGGDQTYCGMKVRGLFIGWRGGSFREWGPEPLASVIAASTFMNRKVVSDGAKLTSWKDTPSGLPVSVAAALREVERALQLRDSAGHGADRMLVIGHSLGGNVLLQGFKADIVAAIGNHTHGHLMPPVIGDLMVLINPATSAADWIEAVRPVRAVNLVPPNWRWTPDSHHYFPLRQPPTIMALTATCPFNDKRFTSWDAYWSTYFSDFLTALSGSADTACDWVTGFALPAAQILLNDERAYARTAMGQLVPTTPSDPIWPPKYIGVTHGFELNHSTNGVLTSLASSVAEPVNRCAEVPGWLTAARERMPRNDHYGNWDAGNKSTGPLTALAPVRRADEAGRWDQLLAQFSHGGSIYRESNALRTDPITTGTDPFWNVAVHSNAIEEHGGYVSYQLWCAINQFVLDDVTNRFAPP